MHCNFRNTNARFLILASIILTAALGCSLDGSTRPSTPDQLQFSFGQVSSLDSTGVVIENANPGRFELQEIFDSTLFVLGAGDQAARIDLSTNLTSAPMYFVGIHRVFNQFGTGSISSWTVVGIDNPNDLKNLIELGGEISSPTSPAPTSMSGAVDSGPVSGLLIQVDSGGAVTEWRATSGSATFSSDGPTVVCPGFVSVKISCSLETMHLQFSLVAPSGSSGSRTASVSVVQDVPALRLNY